MNDQGVLEGGMYVRKQAKIFKQVIGSQRENESCYEGPAWDPLILDSSCFRVRLNCIDHYQSVAGGFDPPLFGSHGSTQQRNAPTLPVIRVFGSTETGQKVCAHIHGALPYLYLEYTGGLEQDTVDAYIHQIRISIDHALAVSYRRNLYNGKAVFVGHITLVKGIPFFGYHVGYRYFLKIYMLNPLHMTRFTDLLHQGAIMQQVLQPFESHLQYLLQWMCDFNLYGCSYIDCKAVKFRSPIPEYLEMSNTKHRWHDRSISQDMISDSDECPRQSHCSLEVDICVQDILNRDEIEDRNIHADFVERFGPLSPDEKLVHSLRGLWKDETKRRKRRMGTVDSASSPFPAEVLISMTADARNSNPGGWIHEEEYRNKVMRLIEEETRRDSGGNLTFESFVKSAPDEASIQTVLESVEDLFPHKFAQHASVDPSQTNDEPTVDESMIKESNDDDFPYDSDEEVAREIALTQKKRAEEVASLQKLDDGAPDPGISVQDPSAQKIEESWQPIDGIDADAAGKLGLANGYETPQGPNGSRKRHTSEADQRDGQIFGSTWEHRESKRTKAKHNESEGHHNSDDECVPGQSSSHNSMPKSVSFGHNMITNDHEKKKNRNSKEKSLDTTPTPSQKVPRSSLRANGVSPRKQLSYPIVKDPYASLSKRSSQQRDTGVTHTKTPTPKSRPITTVSPTTPFSKGSSTSAATSPFHVTSQPSPKTLQLAKSYIIGEQARRSIIFGSLPPSSREVSDSFFELGLPSVIYQDAFYSDEKDVPDRARDYAGREFKLESMTMPFLPTFDSSGTSLAAYGDKPPVVVDTPKEELAHVKRRQRCRLRHWEIEALPPSFTEVSHWLRMERPATHQDRRPTSNPTKKVKLAQEKTTDLSQIEGPTQHGRHGFKFSQKRDSTSVQHETQYMSTMSLEVHVNSRENLAPNPEMDEIACIFWCIKSDDDELTSSGNPQGLKVGILILAEDAVTANRVTQEAQIDVEHEDNELDLINRMVDIVREYDPDILTGYEVHNGSWGYLMERARLKYEYNLCDEFSRMLSQSHGRFGKDADRWGFNNTSTIRVTGRHMINVWRAMRSELNLLQYTMENVVFNLLHKRIPHYSFKDLTRWYTTGKARDTAKVIHYFLSRVKLNLEILDANELIPRTSEQARLIGVDFFSVFSRGSQFKVESFMFRIAKPENFLLVSPSRKQVGQQNALECLPLVMEPQSAFYNSPLLVLDFQSLYPSIMIAYNYCYSTCLGRVVGWRGQNKMGFADFKRQPGLLALVKDSINVAPNGMMYVKPSMRKSLLAKMLGEILETRVMVKSGMKVDKADKTLQQLLNNRQLALKLLANVTYGYTSASFSGRMPCSEIADSIVQTGRETLERAIATIHANTTWGAEVVYGDTDSLFVYLRGRTRAQAFTIGGEIASAITAQNPRPIKLKFEKVYHPCVLLAKKRYVGFKYESPKQIVPDFDAKGIETVRRDGTPAEQKVEEKALKILFRTADLSQVKAYFLHQCRKLLTGAVSIQDFFFAREVKLGTYADKGPPPPGALISTRKMLEDPRAEPQYGERVPYVVITGAPGARLIDRCVAPERLLSDESAELDAEYYISKNLIPPLERIFNLVGADVRRWYDDMPKTLRIREVSAPATTTTATTSVGAGNAGGAVGKDGAAAYMPNGQPYAMRRTLETYLKTSHCAVCRSKLPPPVPPPSRGRTHQRQVTSVTSPQGQQPPLCPSCLDTPSTSLYKLRMRLREAEQARAQVESVCRSCAGLGVAEEVRCVSGDCPVFYTRVRARAREGRIRGLVDRVGVWLERESEGEEKEEMEKGALEW